MNYTLIKGKKVSQITLGTVQLGLDYGIANKQGRPSIVQSFDVLHTAFSGGITSIDTARGYGESEYVIGKYLEKNKDFIPYISTKYKNMTEDNAPYAKIEREIFDSINCSLNNLGVKKLDCLLLHNAGDKIKNGDSIARAFEKAKKEGFAEMIGFSAMRNPVEIDEMLQYDIYETVQIPMNIFDRRIIEQGYLDKLIDKNIYIFVRSVFFQGLLFLNPLDIISIELKKYAGKYLKKLKEIAISENLSVAQLAISYISILKGVDSIVLGSENSKQVLENINFLKGNSISEIAKRDIDNALKGIETEKIMRLLADKK